MKNFSLRENTDFARAINCTRKLTCLCACACACDLHASQGTVWSYNPKPVKESKNISVCLKRSCTVCFFGSSSKFTTQVTINKNVELDDRSRALCNKSTINSFNGKLLDFPGE